MPFFRLLSGVPVPPAAEQQQLQGQVPSCKEAKGKPAEAFPGIGSESVPEVHWLFFFSNLDNQIYPLIAKVMPLLVTRS